VVAVGQVARDELALAPGRLDPLEGLLGVLVLAELADRLMQSARSA
jgi:hypothetical protein